MLKKILIIIYLVSAIGNSFSEDGLTFHIPKFPPYIFEENGEVRGIGFEIVDKIFKELNISYTLKLVPNYGRALKNVKSGKSDGFFLATQNTERDKVAVFSKPIITNNWCWFVPVDSKINPHSADFKQVARVGTFLNSNTHKWLSKNNYNVTGSIPDYFYLIEMMETSRINVIYLSESVFYDLLDKRGLDRDDYIKVIHISTPFGIYISKKYLLNNPGIIEKINSEIDNLLKD